MGEGMNEGQVGAGLAVRERERGGDVLNVSSYAGGLGGLQNMLGNDIWKE